MTFGRAERLSDNEYSVLGQPMYLLIALIITALIIALFVLSLQNIARDSHLHHMQHEIDAILAEAATMFEYANEGTLVNVHVEFPSSLQFIVFGSLPLNGSTEPTNLTLNDTISNNYYFVMDDGALYSFHTNARFSSQNLTQIAIFHSGVYDLTLELCYDDGKTFVKIY